MAAALPRDGRPLQRTRDGLQGMSPGVKVHRHGFPIHIHGFPIPRWLIPREGVNSPSEKLPLCKNTQAKRITSTSLSFDFDFDFAHMIKVT